MGITITINLDLSQRVRLILTTRCTQVIRSARLGIAELVAGFCISLFRFSHVTSTQSTTTACSSKISSVTYCKQERISIECKPPAYSLNRQKHRQMDGWTDRQTDRQTDGQT